MLFVILYLSMIYNRKTIDIQFISISLLKKQENNAYISRYLLFEYSPLNSRKIILLLENNNLFSVHWKKSLYLWWGFANLSGIRITKGCFYMN